MSTTGKFSWVTEIQGLRNAASGQAAKLDRLRYALQCQPIQGFEVELLGRLLVDLENLATVHTQRVAILSNYSIQPLANAVRVAAFKEGLSAVVYEAPYGSLTQEVLSPGSGLYTFRPTVVLMAIGIESIEHIPIGPLSDDEVSAALAAEVRQFESIWGILNNKLGVPVLQHTIVTPEQVYTGQAERTVPWSMVNFVASLNKSLMAAAPASVHWLDVNGLAMLVGLNNWHDPRVLHHAKFSFATKFLPEYASWFGATLRGALGAAPKALILDLDNTLWGGVIGDDGLDGIRLGPESAEGEAYMTFCRYVRELGRRGVILGISSKNDLKNAAEVFERHPHMPLRMSDFAAVRCNWSDKAANLMDIARELNIDPTAMVFVDDNPAECERVRQELPGVRVIQVDGDPASFVRRLDSLNLFYAQRLSKEDLLRMNSYQARARSEELRSQAGDLGLYLQSLEMRGSAVRASDVHLARLAQMEIKTNQFNLSTRRLSQEQLEKMAKSQAHVVLAVSLVDRFADHGLVAYIAAELLDAEMVITDWVMSCRVFSRTLEEFTFIRLLQIARERGIKAISLRYQPTVKNGVMVASLEALGLRCVDDSPARTWVHEIGVDIEPRTYVA